ncbi:serine/threonine protein kinase [Roseibium sp.]|uniref:serine/threonine protein kinase n=1 Tax=Roseibium sp. TaxID=1936156 RepID=UPI003A975947
MMHQYRLDEVIGQGGFGITYLAYDTELQRNVAIKECFPRDFVSREGSTIVPTSAKCEVDFNWAVDKFIAEATTLAKFRHPGIVQVLQILKGENNSAYMVLEYVEGQSLDAWLKSLNTPPSQRQLESVIELLLDALGAVHLAGFAHRDIAPDNIYIRKNGEAVLLDFGAAKMTAANLSKTMNLVVKDGYSAPEQYYSEGRQGPWTDIYAFSATMYRCLTGKKPIDAMARLDALNNNEPDPLTPLEELGLSGYTPGFLAAVQSGLSPQAKGRPQDINAWRVLLASAGFGNASKQAVPEHKMQIPPEPSLAISTGTPAEPIHLGHDAVAAGTSGNPFPQGWEGAKTGSTWRWLAGIAVVLAGALGGGYWFQQHQQSALEQQAYAQAQALESPALLEAFLEKFPDSENVGQARAALRNITLPWEIQLDAARSGAALDVISVKNNIAVVGSISAEEKNDKDAVIYELSLSGRERWKTEFGGPGDQLLNSVTSMRDGGYVAAGLSSGGGFDLGQGLVVRFSNDGTIAWQRRFGGPGDDTLHSVITMSNGNLAVAGVKRRVRGRGAMGWLLMLTPQGELIKERVFEVSGGGVFRALQETAGGGLVLVGNSEEDEPEREAFWVVRLSSDGDKLFETSFGESRRSRFNDVASGVAGDFILVGETDKIGKETRDGFLVRLTPDDKLPPLPLFAPGDNALTGVDVASDGGVLVVGVSRNAPEVPAAAWLLQLDAGMHEVLKNEKLTPEAGSLAASSVVSLPGGGSILAGQLWRSDGTDSDRSIWIKKL